MTKSNKTITVSRAKEALAGWDGMVEVSFHKIGDSVADSIVYDDIAYAVADFNEIVTWYENNNLGGHMVILSKTWMEEPEDGCLRGSIWKSEPVIVRTANGDTYLDDESMRNVDKLEAVCGWVCDRIYPAYLTHTKPEPDSWSSVWADVSNGNESPEGMMRRCRALAERDE